jgi:hypothetical protein
MLSFDMKNILLVLFTLFSVNAFAAEGSFYHCIQSGTYELDDIYVFRISNWDIWMNEYPEQYYVWDMQGKEVDQGAYLSTMKPNFFSMDYPYNFQIRHIPGDHYYKCKQLINPPAKIKKMADEIKPIEE